MLRKKDKYSIEVIIINKCFDLFFILCCRVFYGDVRLDIRG